MIKKTLYGFNTFLALLVIGALLLSSRSFAQLKSKNQFNFNTDFARYAAKDGWIYVEVYYSFLREKLRHEPIDGVLKGTYKVELTIFRGDSLLNSANWSSYDAVQSLEKINSIQRINDVRQLMLRNGNYKINVKLTDLSDGYFEENTLSVDSADFDGASLKLSDIQLGLNMSTTDSKSRFVKNGVNIIPNPTSMYNLNWSILYYYLEIYNLSPLLSGSDSTFSVTASIKSRSGDVIKTLPAKKKKRVASAVIEYGQTFIGSLFSGAYAIQVDVHDHGSDQTISAEKYFYVVRPGDYIDSDTTKIQIKAEASVFTMMSEDELDHEFDLLRYTLSSDDKDKYEKLNLTGKIKFMENFWERKERLNSKNGKNRKAYLKLVDLANSRFTSGGKKGWRTDRGRVLLTYGEPDEMDKMNSGIKNYEVWFYQELEGGVQFVFVDIAGYGDLKLVHSTLVTEIQDYDWQQKYLK